MTNAIGLKKVEDLMRRLIEEGAAARAGRPDTSCGPDGEEILFDVEVDGSRYLLVRLMKADDTTARLSPREQEIVRLVALGHSNKIIGDVLSISSWTVCTHLRRIFAKLGVGSRAAMVARLSSRGAAQPPPQPAKKNWPKEPELEPDALELLDAEPHAVTRGVVR